MSLHGRSFSAWLQCSATADLQFARVSDGIASRPGLVARLSIVALFGVVWQGYVWAIERNIGFARLEVILFAAINALAESLGIFCGMRSLEASGAITGVNTALFDANSVLVVLLNVFLLSYEPPVEKYVGMAAILLGCCIVSVSPRQVDKEQ